MKNITHHQYRILCDHMDVYRFMTDIYERDWRNGVPAPFLEYALSSDWMDKSYMHRCRIWKDGEKIVALVFMENPVTDVYFSLRPGYEALAEDMVAYAAEHMPNMESKQRLILFGGQTALLEAAEKAGYRKVWENMDCVYDFSKPLAYRLPEGYRFAEHPLDAAKCSACCWKGFGHEAEEGPWDGNCESAFALEAAPHATFEHALAIENEAGEYVCYAGMWWTPENNLAYMEPLCTVPEHQHKGLAAAILSEHYRRMSQLGATHMTGGENPFYQKIGYEPVIKWTYWEKPKENA